MPDAQLMPGRPHPGPPGRPRRIRLPVRVLRERSQVRRVRRAIGAAPRGGAPAGEGALDGGGSAGAGAVRDEEVAAALQRPLQEVAVLLRLVEAPSSLDAPLARGGTASILDGVADAQAVDPLERTLGHEHEALLAEVLATLNEREREVLAGRYGLAEREPETLEHLAARLGLTRERVRQIQQEALLKLWQRMARRGVGRESLF